MSDGEMEEAVGGSPRSTPTVSFHRDRPEMLTMRGLGRGRFFSPASSTSPNLTVIVPTPRKVRRFSGEDSAYTVDEFISSVSRAIPREEDSVQFVLEHLEGAARREVRSCGQNIESLIVLFSVLRAAFGDDRTLPEITRSFASRVQGPQEGIREYSCALSDLFSDLQKKEKSAGRPVSSQEVLNDQFIEGLQDKNLVWELRCLRRDRQLDYAKLRVRALEWESLHKGKGRPRVSSHMAATDSADSEFQSLKAEIHRLKKMLEEQAKSSRIGGGDVDERSRGRGQTKFRWTDSGQPICFKCKQPGHMQGSCPKNKPGGRKSEVQVETEMRGEALNRESRM
ncbi:uncharacterized protein [Littorina saxatilis]|uniref:uncharacterized protein n=1 Tax=Littorina saxatilis TaxID=31220 RepID=UPI0038B64DEC